MNLATAFRFRVPRAAGVRVRPPLSRRRAARRALLSGAAALALLTAGMAVALDVGRPQWRDPEFYVRLDRLKRWQAEAPARPLVVAFGSSRTQMGLAPAAMGYPDRPGSPLVFNMGYRAGHPLGAHLQFTRTLDADVKPRAVLFQLANNELMVAGPAETQYVRWAPRFSAGDLARLAPYTRDGTVLPRLGLAGRLNPWETYRLALHSDLLPGGQGLTALQKVECFWERADGHGFIPHHPESLTSDQRARGLDRARAALGRARTEFRPSEITERVFRDAVARCRAEGVAVAFFWAPISPAYRSWQTPAVHAEIAAYKKRLEVELGVTVFPAPDDLLAEEDFADGFHLLRRGAEKYSRWLADTHLSPWLRSQGLIGP